MPAVPVLTCFEQTAIYNSSKAKEQKNMSGITRDAALELLKKYNKDPFHIQPAFTVEAVMKRYANELGYGDQEEYWGI